MVDHDVALIAAARPPAEPALEPALLPVVVYAASSELVHPLQLVHELLSDIVRGRELGWRLFLRNLQAQYRQTLFGYVWAIMPPLMTTLVWVGLRSVNVVNFNAVPGVPYAAYVLAGTILWQTFLNVPVNTLAITKPAHRVKLPFRFVSCSPRPSTTYWSIQPTPPS